MFEINVILFDDPIWENLLPITYTRSVVDIRIGITTIKEKWERYSKSINIKTKEYLSDKYTLKIDEDNFFINAGLIPDLDIISAIKDLNKEEILIKDNKVLAYRSSFYKSDINNFPVNKRIIYNKEVILIEHPWDIFRLNEKLLVQDFVFLTKGRKSQILSKSNNIIAKDNIFVEEGAKVEYATINAGAGPVYIGKDSEVMEGALIRGPVALCEHSTIKMGAKIYEATTIGPWCKVAGEIQNAVFTGYSNKAHDGFLGNSVLGEWCNLGADTNTSNLKNNYDKVKVWNYNQERFVQTGLQFCGLIMGDHSKCGINTMFNTGTVVGVSANIFGSGFPRNFIPSFSWGGAGGFIEYKFEKAIETAKIVYSRRKLTLVEQEIGILEAVFDNTKKYRK